MRQQGAKLPTEAIKATGTVLRLTFERHPLGQPTSWAKAFDVVTNAEVGFLKSAEIKLIDKGIMIAGFELVNGDAQLWWCLPLSPEQNAEMKIALQRIDEKMAAHAATDSQ